MAGEDLMLSSDCTGNMEGCRRKCVCVWGGQMGLCRKDVTAQGPEELWGNNASTCSWPVATPVILHAACVFSTHLSEMISAGGRKMHLTKNMAQRTSPNRATKELRV